MMMGANSFGADIIANEIDGGCFMYHHAIRQRSSACTVIDAHREKVSVENRRPITTVEL